MDPAATREILKKVRQVELRTRRLVTDALAGEYHSVFKGRGMDFEELREYMPGDDVRDIDWNVTGRMGRPFVKRFREERELGVILAVSFDLPVRIEPLFIGKASTACQIAYIALALVLRVADLGTPAWLYWAAVATAFATAASWAAYGFVLVQGLAIRMRRQR